MSDKKTHNDNNKQRPLRSNLKEGAGLHLKDPSSELLDDGIPEQSTTTAEPSNDVPHADQEKPGPSADRKVSDPHSADSIATLMGFQPGKEPHSIPGIVHRKRSDSSEDTLWMASSSGTMPIISPSNVALYTPSTPSLGRQKVGVDDDQQVAVDSSQRKDSTVINVPKVSFDPSVSSHYKGRVVSWAEEVEPEQKFSKVSSDDDLSTDSAKIAQNEQARISIEPTKQHSDIGAPIMMTDAGILKIFPDTGQSKVPPNDELSKVSDIEPTRAVSDTEPSKAVSDTEPSKAVSDIGLSKAVSDVMPSKTIPKIGPSEAVLDVHPSKLGFEVHPSKLDSEVLKSREGTVGKSQEQIIGQDISKGHSYHSMKGHELYGDITSKSPKQGSHSRSSKTSPEKKIIRRQSDRSLHNFMAGSHAALTSAKATGSRFAIQFDTPEGEALERDIWRKKLPNGNEEPIDFDEALQETKFGFFHIALYITCGIIYMACSASLSTLSFTLPASTCALNLTSIDKGQINVFPYIGMLIGTFFWGSISDTKGRKKALLMSLLLDFVAGVLSSFSYNKFMLMLFRVFNGFSIIGATSLVFAYFGEFLTENQGEILLPLIELFYCCGMVYIPALAMLILPYKIHIQIGIIDYQSWNLFTACASIPSFTGLVFVSFFPESPKFTHITGRLQETFDTLKKMYRINTRKSTSKFPVNCLIDSDTAKKLESNKFTLSKVITQQFLDLFSAYKELFGNEMRARTILCCVIDFCFNFGYLTLVIWVPELLERMAKYSSFYKKSAAMCEASEALSTILDQSDSECHTITHDIYVHALVITSSSFPVVIITFLFLRCISKKFILSVLLLLTGISALLFIHVQEQSFMIFLCAMFESSATLLETLLFIIIVEIFPTTIAGTALAVTASSGRFGAIIGNMFIGFFVDSHCQLPVYSFGICFFIAALLVLFLPSKK
ncbi:synaptic vesicle glycoprotein 2B-like isoform X9 [Cimex lectularius]|uniref:Major facilitator superfamily (MFS) profile domain-containing protein n=1 Tax=Cimex lectularius TaxID=79782 RepID=A0A8I6SET3_CIMLE|nr:synaptic vesicle glycoprotein 2B-like isoform X9 [Cimex lectularius]